MDAPATPEPAAAARAAVAAPATPQEAAAASRKVVEAAAAARKKLQAQTSSTLKVSGARAVASTPAQRKALMRKKNKKEGCTVGMDREKRLICRSGEKEFRVPRLLVPLLLVGLLLLLFVRSGASESHIAAAEHVHSYTGSLDGAALTVLASAVSTLSGVAPGALFVPIFITIEGLNPHDAIPLSLATTLGGATAVVLRDWTKAHPLRPNRKLVDLQTAALLAPPVSVGCLIGVYVDKILPPWLLTLLLTATLVFFTVKAAREGRDTLAPVDPLAAPPATAAAGAATDLEAAAAAATGGGAAPSAAGTAESEAAQQKLAAVSAVLLGGTIVQAIAPCGGAFYWLGAAGPIFVLTSVGLWHAQGTIAAHVIHTATPGYVYAAGDIKWDETKAVNGAVSALGGGVATGLLGLGTGPTTIPTSSLLGLLPEVSAPTTATITAVAALGGCLHFMVLGLLSGWLAIWQAVLGFAGVVIGQQITVNKLLPPGMQRGGGGGGGALGAGRDAAQVQGRAMVAGAVVVGVCALLLMRHGLQEVSSLEKPIFD